MSRGEPVKRSNIYQCPGLPSQRPQIRGLQTPAICSGGQKSKLQKSARFAHSRSSEGKSASCLPVSSKGCWRSLVSLGCQMHRSHPCLHFHMALCVCVCVLSSSYKGTSHYIWAHPIQYDFILTRTTAKILFPNEITFSLPPNEVAGR